MDKKFNVHVFGGNIQRQIKSRGDFSIQMINGHHRSGVCYEVHGVTWYRLMHHFGPTKWLHLKDGCPIVDDQFDFGNGVDITRLNGKN